MDVPSLGSSDAGVPSAADAPQAQPERVEPPRTVIRGESSGTLGEAAFTDWLNVTFPLGSADEPVRWFFDLFSRFTAGVFGGMTDRDRGLHGYSRSFQFDHGGVHFALGGQRQTAFVSIPGEGCGLVRSWDKLIELFRDQMGGRITRWDGAVDDLFGTHSVDLAAQMWSEGGFSTGGNRPCCTQGGNWIEPDGRGRTLYVGKRKNGKMVRIYEKGMQLGAPFHPWVRWEVELHNVDRVVPWEVLLEPGKYVAGAYPCMRWINERASRIRTVKAQDAITYERLKHCGSLAYGALINVMLEREGSPERVVELLRRIGVPRRLVGTDEVLRLNGDNDAI